MAETVQVSRRDMAQWVSQFVLPALQKLAESKLRDFGGFEKATGELPKALHSRWNKRIKDMKSTMAQMLVPSAGTPASLQRIFISMLKVLNERLFIEMELFLARHAIRHDLCEADSLWDHARVEVNQIVRQRRLRFADREVPVFFLDSVTRGTHSGSFAYAGAYDRIQKLVLISLQNVRREIVQMRHACGLVMQPWERRWVPAGWQETEIFERYAGLAIQLFPMPQDLFQAMLARTLIEELRHAVDSLRVHDRMGGHGSALEYYRRFADLKLSPRGKIRPTWIDSHSQGEMPALGTVVSELSAQMTAAAVGPDPRLVLAEWACNLVNDNQRKHSTRHSQAALFGIDLLAEQFGISRDFAPRESGLP
jgi:hypothetical protein